MANSEVRFGTLSIALRRLLALIMGAMGLAMAFLGAKLAWIGGSPYYVAAGIVLLVCAAMLWRHYAKGTALYAAFYVATLLWALWESGLDGWALVPRLAVFTAFGAALVFLRPVAKGPRLGTRMPELAMLALALAGIAWIFWPYAPPASAVASAADPAAGAPSEWTFWGGSQGGERHVAAAQITPANVGRLQVAWTYKLPGDGRKKRTGFQSVPLKIGNVLFVCTGFSRAFAIDAETGREIWRHVETLRWGGSTFSECRGVSYYRSPKPLPSCTERILYNTVDARLVALDTRTGRRCPDFGEGGEVDLLKGMGSVIDGYYNGSSPPQIVRGKAVINGRIADGQFVGEPGGVIRAYDAVTGRFAWAFDAGRPDDHGEPPAGSHYTRGTPNSWAPMSADEELGLVYLPVGNSTPDYYSGYRRPFDNAHATSVLALDAETGAMRWNFQTVHLDIWDYDVGSQPVLTDFPVGGQKVPALILGTKRGEIFVLDRRTGRPLTQVEERPAPASTVPGEKTSPTQPYSTGFPSLGGPPLTEATMWGISPLDQAACRILFREAHYDGQFTPMALDRPTVIYPGYFGGMNTGSVSIDRNRGILVAGSVRLANYNKLITQKEVKRRGLYIQTPDKVDTRGGDAPQAGTPYGALVSVFMSPIGAPCQQPPYGMLTGIDLASRRVLWSHPIGSAEDLGPLGIPSRLPLTMGVPMVGGAITTGSGLTFIAGTADRHIRAFDTRSGHLLWQAKLPESGQATPISYVSDKSGRQFVVISAGGVISLSGKRGEYLVAFALPGPKHGPSP